jgi:hypothetical protein
VYVSLKNKIVSLIVRLITIMGAISSFATQTPTVNKQKQQNFAFFVAAYNFFKKALDDVSQ